MTSTALQCSEPLISSPLFSEMCQAEPSHRWAELFKAIKDADTARGEGHPSCIVWQQSVLQWRGHLWRHNIGFLLHMRGKKNTSHFCSPLILFLWFGVRFPHHLEGIKVADKVSAVMTAWSSFVTGRVCYLTNVLHSQSVQFNED